MIWTATRDELREDFALMAAAHEACGVVETNARIAYHDNTQDAVKVVTPAPRFVAALMAGGYIKRKRCIGQELLGHDEEGKPIWGLPMFEGEDEVMPALTHDEAIAFLAWRDLPPGCNNFQIMHTDDLPRIGGCIDRARRYRAAWRLQEAA